jgi:SAM-dependent methyltransferase
MPRFWVQTSDVCGPFASGQEELRAFLGDKYAAPSDFRLIEGWQASTRKTPREIEDFYRSTDAYLYDLTKWHSSNRFPYAEVIGDFAWRHGFKRLLEFGCGIGTDGLKLLQRGFEVTFYDFRNPSTEYLKWRLTKRGSKAAILYAGEDDLPTSDLTLAIDVIEHLVDPAGTLKELASRTKALVPHFPITTQPRKYPMHFHLKKRHLRRVIRDQGFRRVRDLSQLRYKWALVLWLSETPDFWLRNDCV